MILKAEIRNLVIHSILFISGFVTAISCNTELKQEACEMSCKSGNVRVHFGYNSPTSNFLFIFREDNHSFCRNINDFHIEVPQKRHLLYKSAGILYADLAYRYYLKDSAGFVHDFVVYREIVRNRGFGCTKAFLAINPDKLTCDSIFYTLAELEYKLLGNTSDSLRYFFMSGLLSESMSLIICSLPKGDECLDLIRNTFFMVSTLVNIFENSNSEIHQHELSNLSRLKNCYEELMELTDSKIYVDTIGDGYKVLRSEVTADYSKFNWTDFEKALVESLVTD